MMFGDHYTKYTWIYPIFLKSDIFNVFTNFKSWVEDSKTKIVTLYSNMGGEFHKLKTFFLSHGVQELATLRSTPLT